MSAFPLDESGKRRGLRAGDRFIAWGHEHIVINDDRDGLCIERLNVGREWMDWVHWFVVWAPNVTWLVEPAPNSGVTPAP